MANLDAQVRESQEQVAEAQGKIAELTSRIETARAKLKAGDAAEIDIENASLEDVHAHTEVMNANIAELIMGLDDVTSGFSRDFDEMRSKTGWESVIGIFSSAKSDSMRQERVRSASIDDKLQDLIAKSDTIVQLLEGQLAVLEEQKTKVEVNLVETLDDREMTVAELESLRTDIPKLSSLRMPSPPRWTRPSGLRWRPSSLKPMGATTRWFRMSRSNWPNPKRWSATSTRARHGWTVCRTKQRRRWC